MMGLAVPSPVGRERVRVRVNLFELASCSMLVLHKPLDRAVIKEYEIEQKAVTRRRALSDELTQI
jgi:hypothetical protein